MLFDEPLFIKTYFSNGKVGLQLALRITKLPYKQIKALFMTSSRSLSNQRLNTNFTFFKNKSSFLDTRVWFSTTYRQRMCAFVGHYIFLVNFCLSVPYILQNEFKLIDCFRHYSVKYCPEIERGLVIFFKWTPAILLECVPPFFE